MEIRIQKQAPNCKQEAQWLERAARLALQKLSRSRAPGAQALKRAELSISLVTDRSIHRLNREWRHKDKATDVLSFPQFSIPELRAEPREGEALPLGDVIISLQTAKRQSKEKGVAYRKELHWLLVHGILHLLGYDHEISAKEDRRMRQLERRVLQVLLTR